MCNTGIHLLTIYKNIIYVEENGQSTDIRHSVNTFLLSKTENEAVRLINDHHEAGSALLLAATWNTWGSWSECSQTCQGGTRFRRRTCQNGNLCNGTNVGVEYCKSNVPCTDMRKLKQIMHC